MMWVKNKENELNEKCWKKKKIEEDENAEITNKRDGIQLCFKHSSCHCDKLSAYLIYDSRVKASESDCEWLQSDEKSARKFT